ncbi:VRR-NUC domain-containing protein [Pseudomonas oryzihabitans]|uniref:VRR-NUC domain-containing protein n=1 Tax=Pseudomonas oryzihabitans TaxID=47885 RepID=UPI0028960B33|nr:VRR-NUC domain-containing protein [Pseudomonas oryzihabitans]MDT3718457.1 VRR-NUC domain-containing protein [Pseudomonas oryzihabitans]
MTAALKSWAAPREARTRKKKPVDWEGKEQAALFRWIDLQYPKDSKLIYHVPNGGDRHMLTAKKLKAQGVRAGMPDINIDIPRGGWHGMRIEFKATPPRDADVAANQEATLQLLNDQGYLAIVCRGVHDAEEHIRAYMRLPKTEVIQ